MCKQCKGNAKTSQIREWGMGMEIREMESDINIRYE